MRWRDRGRAEAELTALLGRPARVLARASGDGVAVVGLVDGLAVRQFDSWELIEWHWIRHGGWNEGARTLSWVLADDTSCSVVLDDPGRIPEMFQERVKASIVVEDRTPAPGGGTVVLVGRRALGSDPDVDPSLVWQVLAEGPARLDDPAVKDHILTRVRLLESDYSV